MLSDIWTFLTSQSDIWLRIAEHLWISFISVVIAAAIALPVGLFIGHIRRGSAVLGALTGAARALPTLGLLTLFGLALGIGLRAPILALVILAIPSLLAGAYSSVEAMPRRIRDAARAIGMTESQIMWRVELPLAAPVIVGAIRAATLQVIATATLAAYITDYGLGRYLFTGLKTRDYPQMLAGALLVIALAIACELVLGKLQKVAAYKAAPDGAVEEAGSQEALSTEALATEATAATALDDTAPRPGTKQRQERWRAALPLLAGVGVIIAVIVTFRAGIFTGISDEVAEDRPVVVGSQDYYSNEIIAEIYAQGLEHAGIDVRRDFRIGQREVYMPELADGKIDVFPEYSGNLAQYLGGGDVENSSPESVYNELQQLLPPGLRALPPAPATDQDSFVVTRAMADEYGLHTIADLRKIPGVARLGANSELAQRPYGPDGIREVYRAETRLVPIEDSGGPLTVRALRAGSIDVADIYSADPVLASDEFVILEDPAFLLTPSQVTPIVSDRTSAEVAAVLKKISQQLTAEDLRDLNSQSANDELAAPTIASRWLAEKNLD